ncbi:MAG: matrixin family metalloprotease [Phycisphaerales bacterium]|nr:matrixin family metalloprotease [Phycisphaerales bacterium]MCB9856741.1 matrixin family metalloprotease [Phycisphaerales bacterium]MCB9862132.1 matrixin family metalloprotease [Phycisphaerales bacterium]
MLKSRWNHSAIARYLAICLFGIVASGANCPNVDSGLGATPLSPTTALTGGADFGSAASLAIADGEQFEFTGRINNGTPDVFDLGAVSPGDRIVVEVVAASGSTLDPVIAIFDANEELFSLSDDVNADAGNFNSAIDDVVEVSSSRFFLAITKFFLDSSGGAYNASVRIERGGQVPTRPVQTILLNFAGGTAVIQNEGTFILDPFDAADIDPAYAGETDLVKQTIVDTMVENFADFGAVIVTTDENPTLTPGTYSTIHFGAFSSTKFGVADDVDVGNMDYCDDGIIFTNGFDNPFASRPSATGIGVAIGNVAAHEAGHLLGLSHVSDVTALMDNTGTASTLLADQSFKTAPISPSVFPIGMQNAPALLDRVIPAP